MRLLVEAVEDRLLSVRDLTSLVVGSEWEKDGHTVGKEKDGNAFAFGLQGVNNLKHEVEHLWERWQHVATSYFL